MWNELVSFCESLPKEKFSRAEISKKKIVQMVADGRLSAASASLLSEALVEPTEENIRKLQEKHPAQDIPSDFVSASECVPIFIESSLVLKKLRSFN
jgi:hypothetical protein